MKKYILIPIIGAFFLLSFKAGDYFEISKNLEIFAEVYKEVNTTYVDEVKPGELIRAAIDGMLKSLDPYTNFYSEAQAEDYKFQVTGTYSGIGASIRRIENRVYIDSPLEGKPCQKAGLMAGDEIITIDGISIKDKTKSEVHDLLTGQSGSTISVEVDRLSVGRIKKDLIRESIIQKNVPYYGVIDDIGFIKLVSFTPKAGKEVRDAVTLLKNQGAQKLVLDLRNNGGGLLNEAIDIVNIFVPRGQLIVETRGKYPEDNRSFKTLNAPVDIEIPLVVMINGNSASASEIVAGSLQDLDRAVVVGRNSFGKGLVQTTKGLSYNTSMKITTSKYYIPSGRLIQRLDYSNKIKGKAVAVSDSSKRLFKTKNGREVIDGEGIHPDVKVKARRISELSQSLIKNHLFFKYANIFRSKNDTIDLPLEFNVSDYLFNEFRDFIKDKDYNYITRTEKDIKQLESQAKEDKYHKFLSAELTNLKSAMDSIKMNDTENHKSELKELLEQEIVRRYFYQRGEIEVGFDDDADWHTSKEILSDLSVYNQHLAL
ncbi:MAG: S41 family peptidase [Bacteroidia bacterium]|nr:S41 family peptidase [Bacteroidia bacterium]